MALAEVETTIFACGAARRRRMEMVTAMCLYGSIATCYGQGTQIGGHKENRVEAAKRQPAPGP